MSKETNWKEKQKKWDDHTSLPWPQAKKNNRKIVAVIMVLCFTIAIALFLRYGHLLPYQRSYAYYDEQIGVDAKEITELKKQCENKEAMKRLENYGKQ